MKPIPGPSVTYDFGPLNYEYEKYDDLIFDLAIYAANYWGLKQDWEAQTFFWGMRYGDFDLQSLGEYQCSKDSSVHPKNRF